MAIAAGCGLRAILLRLCVKTVVVTFMWFIVKERTGEIRELLARAVTTLALKICSWSRRRRSLRAADDCSFIWSDWN